MLYGRQANCSEYRVMRYSMFGLIESGAMDIAFQLSNTRLDHKGPKRLGVIWSSLTGN